MPVVKSPVFKYEVPTHKFQKSETILNIEFLILIFIRFLVLEVFCFNDKEKNLQFIDRL